MKVLQCIGQTIGIEEGFMEEYMRPTRFDVDILIRREFLPGIKLK